MERLSPHAAVLLEAPIPAGASQARVHLAQRARPDPGRSMPHHIAQIDQETCSEVLVVNEQAYFSHTLSLTKPLPLTE